MYSIVLLLVLVLIIVLAFPTYNYEGFVDVMPVPITGLPYGFYKIDDTTMAKIPYGYELDLSDTSQKKIIPVTNTNFYKSKPIPIPANGIPDGYYKVSDGFMSILPPDMKPNVIGIYGDGSFIYGLGYVSEIDYYAKSYPIPIKENTKNEPVDKLPPGTYFFTDSTISILPYGKIANGISPDGTKLKGYKDNTYLMSSTGKFANASYKDVKNNLNVEYHDSADQIIADTQFSLTDMSFGAITVLNPSGEYVVIPRSAVEGDITYLKPGSFRYTPGNYVPNYADSVFLSRVTQLPTVSYYTPATLKKGFCELYKNDAENLEKSCQKLNADSCASSTCCVLLGGSKCVSGNSNGPLDRTNYSDIFVRNKDFYYYQGKCFGNCV